MTLCKIVLITMLSLLAESGARADKLDDFKEAVTKVGCETIPYSDHQSDCKSQQSSVDDWCKGGRGPVSCAVNVTYDLKTQLINEHKNLDALEEKRRGLDEKRSHATDDSEKSAFDSQIEDIDKDIESSKRKIEDLEHELDKRKDQVQKVIDTIDKCIDYRMAVDNIYAYTSDKVQGENDPAIKPYADQLRDMYEASKSGHAKQITEKHNAHDTCTKELP